MLTLLEARVQLLEIDDNGAQGAQPFSSQNDITPFHLIDKHGGFQKIVTHM